MTSLKPGARRFSGLPSATPCCLGQLANVRLRKHRSHRHGRACRTITTWMAPRPVPTGEQMLAYCHPCH